MTLRKQNGGKGCRSPSFKTSQIHNVHAINTFYSKKPAHMSQYEIIIVLNKTELWLYCEEAAPGHG